jgi:chemotaxis protein CheD
MVRMGEFSVSRTPGHVLASIGLGSCIGLVLFEPSRSLVGLAHIVLPSSEGDPDALVGKFADRAIPALIEQMTSLGARRPRLEAVLVGGAQMFALKTASTLDVGRRNEQAAREALMSAGVTVRAAATGGNRGRTVRAYVDTGVVTVKEPGTLEVELFSSSMGVGVQR